MCNIDKFKQVTHSYWNSKIDLRPDYNILKHMFDKCKSNNGDKQLVLIYNKGVNNNDISQTI